MPFPGSLSWSPTNHWTKECFTDSLQPIATHWIRRFALSENVKNISVLLHRVQKSECFKRDNNILTFVYSYGPFILFSVEKYARKFSHKICDITDIWIHQRKKYVGPFGLLLFIKQITSNDSCIDISSCCLGWTYRKCHVSMNFEEIRKFKWSQMR